MIKPFILRGMWFLSLASTAWAAESTPARISRAALLDKIRGAWAGQMIGVSYGALTEFRSRGRIIEGDFKTAKISNAIDQDDLYVEMTFAAVMDKVGLEATCEQYGEAFKNSEYMLWHANAGARRNLNRGLKAPLSGHPKYNIDAKLNGAYIALGQLYGQGDWQKTMEISARCGQDSDCNPSSAAGILGAMIARPEERPRSMWMAGSLTCWRMPTSGRRQPTTTCGTSTGCHQANTRSGS